MQSHPRRRRRPRVLVVGGNFAGIAAAKSMSRDLAVTVVDPSPWFEWLPNIHELISGLKSPQALRLSRRRLVRAAGHRFVRATIESIDAFDGRAVSTEGKSFRFDACIVAVGGENDTLGVPGAERHALPFKSVEDCAAIGARLDELAAARNRAAVVIVGGGLEGVEACGEVLRRSDGASVKLIEAGARLLPGTPTALDARVQRVLREHGVTVRTGARVARVKRRSVALEGGDELRSDATLWTGGARPPALLERCALSAGGKEWAPVRPTLQSDRFDHVFICGDAAGCAPPLGKQAYFALQMGEHAGRAAEAMLGGGAPTPFRPAAKPSLISLGSIETYLVAGNLAVASPLLAFAKEAVYQLTMTQLDPPWAPDGLEGLVGRAWDGASTVLTPALAAPGSWPDLLRVGVVVD